MTCTEIHLVRKVEKTTTPRVRHKMIAGLNTNGPNGLVLSMLYYQFSLVAI